MQRSHDVVVPVDEELFVISQDDLAATVLREEDRVSYLDHWCSDGAVLHAFAGADSDNLAKVKSLLFATGEDDSSLCLSESLGLLDDDTVEQGSEGAEREHCKSVYFSQRFTLIN